MITPTGILNQALSTAASTLSQCAAFQTFVDVDEESETPAADALESIYLWNANLDEITGKFAVVSLDDFKRETTTRGAMAHYDTTGFGIIFHVAGAPPAGSSDKDAIVWIANRAGAIIEDLEGLVEGAGQLKCESIQMTMPPSYFRDDGLACCEFMVEV